MTIYMSWFFFFFSSRRRHTRSLRDWSSDVCSYDLMLLGGLWHGASWTFVVWGGYHGLLLVLYQATRGSWDRLPTSARRVTTFGLVVVGWVFFRSDTFEMAASLLSRLFSWHAGSTLLGAPVLLG